MPSSALLETLLAYEHAVWHALVMGDSEADAAALHDDFLGVYSSGFADKSSHVGQLTNGPTIRAYEITQTHVRPLGADYAVLSYHATFQRIGSPAPEAMFVSSIWQRIGSKWINILSQDTPAV